MYTHDSLRQWIREYCVHANQRRSQDFLNIFFNFLGKKPPKMNIWSAPRAFFWIPSMPVAHLETCLCSHSPISEMTSQNFNRGTCCRPQTKLREGNVFTPACDSVRGGVSVRETPLYGNERVVCILRLE